MSTSAATPASSDSLEWKPLLFVRYREGKKMRTADLRGPEWRESAESPLKHLFAAQARLWEEKAIDIALRDGVPEWVRIVRQYESDTGTAFVPWCDVLAFEYQGEVLPEDAVVLPSPR
ncbi:MAG: hypothetical protein OXI51_03480 [Chloroflexota bacterium]|nr:hypothetical protein [Chloroflexota bacterium]MDE2668700.1 hypothetical protein [Chloroflexota bacterium]